MVPGFEDVPTITTESGSITSFILLLIVLIITCIGLWKIFVKAGKKGMRQVFINVNHFDSRMGSNYTNL
jgi:hypothetical protein